jgi:hypothetical protein
MTREIKFRAWSTAGYYSEEYVERCKTNYPAKYIWDFHEIYVKKTWKDVFTYWFMRYNINVSSCWRMMLLEWWWDYYWSDEESIVMQYTWIKDDNWKNIYEWDLIEWRWFNWCLWVIDRNYYWRGVKLLWYNKDSYETLKEKIPLEKLKEGNEKMKWEWCKIPSVCTVIGNIYEDKHLFPKI